MAPRRIFFQSYFDYDRSFNGFERMAILRVIARNPDINHVEVNSRQAVFKAYDQENPSNSPLEIKMGCNWVQVSSKSVDTTIHLAEELVRAIEEANPKKEVDASGGDA